MTLLIVSSFTISHLNQSKENVLQNKISDNQHNARILAEAKAALLGFASGYSKIHKGEPLGYLPCPNDKNLNDPIKKKEIGQANPPCDSNQKNVLGCLPWKTLGLQQLKDSSGNDLWYAVSGTYKDSPKTLTSEHDNDNKIKINNTNSVQNNVIAVVFLPNAILPNQTRNIETDCSFNKHTNYLESILNNNDDIWTINNFSSTVNDKLIWITTDDYKNSKLTYNKDLNTKVEKNLYEQMDIWVANRVKQCLLLYVEKNNNINRYPWTTEINTTDYNYITDSLVGHIAKNIDKIVNFSTNESISIWQSECFDDNGVGWWNDWKEKVFIIINQKNTPDITQTTSDNLTLDGVGADFIVLIQKKKSNGFGYNTNLSKMSTSKTFESEDSHSIACSNQGTWICP